MHALALACQSVCVFKCVCRCLTAEKVCISLSSKPVSQCNSVGDQRKQAFSLFLAWVSSQVAPPPTNTTTPPSLCIHYPPPLPHPPPSLLLHPLLVSLSPPLPNDSLILGPPRPLNPLCILFSYLATAAASLRPSEARRGVCVDAASSASFTPSLSLPSLFNQHVNKKGN